MKLKLVELNFVWGCSQAIGSIHEGWGSVFACAFSRRGLLASSLARLPSPNGAFPSSEVGGSPLSSVHYVFGCPPLLFSSEVGEASRGGGSEGVDGSPEATFDRSFCFHALGVSHEENVEGFLDLTAQVDAE
jgi:hypothetical protein